MVPLGKNCPNGDKLPDVPKVAQRRSRDELAGMAGVGHTTYERGVSIIEDAPKVIADAVRNNELSINAGYTVTKPMCIHRRGGCISTVRLPSLLALATLHSSAPPYPSACKIQPCTDYLNSRLPSE